MRTRDRMTLQTILIAIVIIVSIVYILFIKPNYYRFNGGKLYLEPIYAESFESKNAYQIYTYNGFLYYSSKNGLKKLTRDRESVWDKTFSVENPKLYTEGAYIAVVDLGGKEAYTFNEEGMLISLKVEAPIVLADISKEGALVLVQEKAGRHLIQLYSRKGVLIAERGTNYSADGYPIGIDLSSTGETMATSYLSLKDGLMKTVVTFFSFSAEGNKDPENILGGFTLEGSVAPEIKFLDDNHVVAVSDNSINFYSINEIPKLEKQIQVKNEINQVAYCDQEVILNFGKAFEVTKEDLNQQIEIYDLKGERIDHYKAPEKVTQIIGEKDHYYVITPKEISYHSLKKQLWKSQISKEAKNILRIGKEKYLIIFQKGYEILEVGDI